MLKGLTIDKKPLKDHLEVKGQYEAFNFIRKEAKKQVPLTKEVITQIHHYLLADKQDDRGVFRKIPVKILGAQHQPIDPHLIATQLDELLTTYNENIEHVATKMARFHIEFEIIHPFISGNGKCGRLLLNLELMKAGFPPIDIRFEERTRYYNAFDMYYEKSNLESMEKLFATYIIEQLDMQLSILE